jgi:hypothetical protein
MDYQNFEISVKDDVISLKHLTNLSFSNHFSAVRFGRVPKREKARIEAAMQQSTRNRALTTNVWTDLEDLQHVIDTVVGAHLETCEFTRDRVREMKLRAKDSPNYTEPTRVSFTLHSIEAATTNRYKRHCLKVNTPSEVMNHSLPDDHSFLPSNEFQACEKKNRGIKFKFFRFRIM